VRPVSKKIAERMRASGEPVPVIAQALGGRATLYRTLAEKR